VYETAIFFVVDAIPDVIYFAWCCLY